MNTPYDFLDKTKTANSTPAMLQPKAPQFMSQEGLMSSLAGKTISTPTASVASLFPQKAPAPAAVDTFNYNANTPQPGSVASVASPSVGTAQTQTTAPATQGTPIYGNGSAVPNYAGEQPVGSRDIYGKITYSAVPGSVAAVAESTGSNIQNELDAFYKAQKEAAYAPVDENSIYQQELADRQKQIDAINAMYADRLNQARIRGQGRVESRQFSQARSGQIGSGVGEAGIESVRDLNTEEQNAILNEKQVAINSIYEKAKSDAKERAAAKTLAKTKSADEYIETLKSQREEQKAAGAKAVAALVASGVDITDMTPEQIKTYKEQLGMTDAELKSEFATQKTAKLKADKESQKLDAEIANKKADTAKIMSDVENWGKLTEYQKAQIAIDNYKAKNPTGTASEKKANAMGLIASEIKQGTTLADGTPIVDESNYFTASGLKYLINNAPQLGLTKKEVLEQFGNFVYIDKELGTIPDSYGLTPADKKIIMGAL